MFVGVDVHKHTHAAALLDERGCELGVFTFADSPAGYQRLIGWLADRDAAEAVIGVESPGSYGRCLVGALAAAGHEVLHVPAWRTQRERRRQGPGKTDPGDALAIADVVRRKRSELGPALQPELVGRYRSSSCSAAASSWPHAGDSGVAFRLDAGRSGRRSEARPLRPTGGFAQTQAPARRRRPD